MDRARIALKEADERRASFARAFESSLRPDGLSIYGAEAGPTDLDARAGFRALKGRTPMPVTGRAEVRRVHRLGAGGPGIELVAASDAAVRAIAPGRVAFADHYDDYGLTVLLDHGDHYYSLYANMRAADVPVGQTIHAGARLGTASGDGKGSSVLYFELRHGTDTIDPAPWLGL
jgi:septal ring factor EnvC (AmiA/AmiB activator)